MENPDLPQEILIHIFTRLPTKSIGKLRCLSKQWRTLLSSPHFIKSHLSRRALNENLILITLSHTVHSTTSAVEHDVVSSKKLDLPGIWTEFVGSCDGLVLLVNYDNEMLLFNPVTLEHVKLPNSPLALNKAESFSMFGFGYDSVTDDYKVVVLSYYDTDNEYVPDCEDTFVDVYSVRRGVWKRVGCSPYDHAVPRISSGAYVNGAIHWLASSREPGHRTVLAAFDLVNEVFSEIPAPSGVNEKFVFNKLVVLGGFLCMIEYRRDSRMDVWIMKEYGVVESWTKYSVCGEYEMDIFNNIICLIGDEEFVVLTEDGFSVVYNVEEKCFSRDVVDGLLHVNDGGTFVESLVSPFF